MILLYLLPLSHCGGLVVGHSADDGAGVGGDLWNNSAGGMAPALQTGGANGGTHDSTGGDSSPRFSGGASGGSDNPNTGGTTAADGGTTGGGGELNGIGGAFVAPPGTAYAACSNLADTWPEALCNACISKANEATCNSYWSLLLVTDSCAASFACLQRNCFEMGGSITDCDCLESCLPEHDPSCDLLLADALNCLSMECSEECSARVP